MDQHCELIGKGDTRGESHQQQLTDDRRRLCTSITIALRAAASQEDELWGFLRHVHAVFRQSLSFIVLRVILVVVAVFVLLVGVFKFRQCPLEQELPLFLILVGVALILKACLSAISSCQNTANNKTERNTVDTCNDILSLFLIFWCLTGSVWTFGIWTAVDVQNPNAFYVHNCNKLVYLCSLSLLIGLYCCLLTVLFIIVIICLYYYLYLNNMKKQLPYEIHVDR